MKLVITRVAGAEVEIGGRIHASIAAGLLILVGIAETDSEQDVKYLARKAAGLRIFSDENGKLNRACRDVGGAVLAVSNFTLCADCRSGNRPSFIQAARPALAEPLYELFCSELRGYGLEVKTGVFGADMQVKSVNDGPVTIVMESEGNTRGKDA